MREGGPGGVGGREGFHGYNFNILVPGGHYSFRVLFSYNLINLFRVDESGSCPTCRDEVKSPEELWEFTEIPNIAQINRQLIDFATGT